jgi:hypothetical protein
MIFDGVAMTAHLLQVHCPQSAAQSLPEEIIVANRKKANGCIRRIEHPARALN